MRSQIGAGCGTAAKWSRAEIKEYTTAELSEGGTMPSVTLTGHVLRSNTLAFSLSLFLASFFSSCYMLLLKQTSRYQWKNVQKVLVEEEKAL